MIYEQAVAIVNTLVPEDQMVSLARKLSSTVTPLGNIRTVEDARNALVHLVRQESERALAEAQRRVASH